VPTQKRHQLCLATRGTIPVKGRGILDRTAPSGPAQMESRSDLKPSATWNPNITAPRMADIRSIRLLICVVCPESSTTTAATPTRTTAAFKNGGSDSLKPCSIYPCQ
jgi:hypothetical protein